MSLMSCTKYVFYKKKILQYIIVTAPHVPAPDGISTTMIEVIEASCSSLSFSGA